MVEPRFLAIFCYGGLAAACFNPSNGGGTPAGSTEPTSTGAESSFEPTGLPTTAGTTADSGESTSSPATSGSSGPGGEIPDWGEGDPPNLGDLGVAGAGNLLVVHALDLDAEVDVWLVGDTRPLISGLAPRAAALIEDIPREVQRVVFARTGTFDAVACSGWFPLRAGQQWGVVAARGPHTCPAPVADGGTIVVEQLRPLSGNPLRFAHAGVPDALTIVRAEIPEAGVLEPLQTLRVQDLPSCTSSGCATEFRLENPGLSLGRLFTFVAHDVADVPTAGEVLLVVLGDLRRDWPDEQGAMTLLRVDIDGTVRAIGRDPEVAVFAPGTSVEVGFSVPAPPSSFEFARVGPCIPGESCVAPIQPFRAGTVRMTAIPDGGAATSAEIVLEAGHRYVVAFTSLAGGELTPIDTAFDRSDASSARGRAFNTHVSGSPLTLGRLFGGNAQPIDGFVEIPSLAVSDEAVLPLGDWELVFALDGGPLGTGCFSSINTPAGWRGLVGVDEVLELDAWPPTTTRLFMACF